jgi:hypothetical protein
MNESQKVKNTVNMQVKYMSANKHKYTYARKNFLKMAWGEIHHTEAYLNWKPTGLVVRFVVWVIKYSNYIHVLIISSNSSQ